MQKKVLSYSTYLYNTFTHQLNTQLFINYNTEALFKCFIHSSYNALLSILESLRQFSCCYFFLTYSISLRPLLKSLSTCSLHKKWHFQMVDHRTKEKLVKAFLVQETKVPRQINFHGFVLKRHRTIQPGSLTILPGFVYCSCNIHSK